MKLYVTKTFYIIILITAIISISTALTSTQAQDAEKYSIICIRNLTPETVTVEYRWVNQPWEQKHIESQQLLSINMEHMKNDELDNTELHISFDANVEGGDQVSTQIESITHRRPECTRNTHHFQYEKGSTRYIELISDLD